MNNYEVHVRQELKVWEAEMLKKPSTVNWVVKGVQNKVNEIIPERAHKVITSAIKQMVRGVLFGSEIMTAYPLKEASLMERDIKVRDQLDIYRGVAIASGWGTGAGGLVLGLADFPILLSIKMKFLYEISALYGYNIRNYKERLFVLYVFQLAFSSPAKRKPVFEIVSNWDEYAKTLPDHEDTFDWKTFQQEYRDYIDFAKMLQLVPVIGAVVGAYANAKLMKQLGYVAMQAYRMRILKSAK